MRLKMICHFREMCGRKSLYICLMNKRIQAPASGKKVLEHRKKKVCCISTIPIFFHLMFLSNIGLVAQNNALILNNAVIINITGGAVLNIDQPHADGIIVNGSGTGYIQSEGETNRVAWHINSGTGNHVIPFGVGGTKINMSYNVTTAGSNDGALVASTYATAINNTPYPSVYAPGVTNMDSTGYVGTNNHSLFTADRFWVLRDVGRPWTTKPTSNLTFTYRDAEFAPGNTITETDLLAQYWNNTQWNPGWYSGFPLLGVNNAAANQVNSINAGSNGNLFTWILVAASHPLPVELITFRASCSPDQKPVVEWITASETNNAYFTLQRSTDGFLWTPVAEISGAGNSNAPLYYSYTDDAAPEGVVYYQLSQTDFDGIGADAGAVTVNCTAENIAGNYELNVYGDNEHLVHVTFTSALSESVTFTLYDMSGKLISRETVTSTEGLNHFVLSKPVVAESAYLFNMTGPLTTESKKIFLK